MRLVYLKKVFLIKYKKLVSPNLLVLASLIFFKLNICFAENLNQDFDLQIDSQVNIKYTDWFDFKKTVENEDLVNRFNGRSQIITGVLALIAGLAGSQNTDKSLERGVYGVFQSIGIASIGFGFYDYYVGNEHKKYYQIIRSTPSLTNDQRTELVKSYSKVSDFYSRRDRYIKMGTFLLLSLTQFYNGSQLKNETIKNSMYFIGAINLVAGVSFAF